MLTPVAHYPASGPLRVKMASSLASLPGWASQRLEDDTPIGQAGYYSGSNAVSVGTVEGIIPGSVFVLNGDQSLTNMNIDGATDITLTYDSAFAGYDRYAWSGSPFVIGSTYLIALT